MISFVSYLFACLSNVGKTSRAATTIQLAWRQRNHVPPNEGKQLAATKKELPPLTAQAVAKKLIEDKPAVVALSTPKKRTTGSPAPKYSTPTTSTVSVLATTPVTVAPATPVTPAAQQLTTPVVSEPIARSPVSQPPAAVISTTPLHTSAPVAFPVVEIPVWVEDPVVIEEPVAEDHFAEEVKLTASEIAMEVDVSEPASLSAPVEEPVTADMELTEVSAPAPALTPASESPEPRFTETQVVLVQAQVRRLLCMKTFQKRLRAARVVAGFCTKVPFFQAFK